MAQQELEVISPLLSVHRWDEIYIAGAGITRQYGEVSDTPCFLIHVWSVDEADHPRKSAVIILVPQNSLFTDN